MSARRYYLLGALLYLVLLVASVPASGFVWIIDRASSGVVTIVGAHGTFWSGEGTLAVSGANPLGVLHWRLHPLWLLLGRVGTTLHVTGPAQLHVDSDARIAFTGAGTVGARGAFSAALIGQTYPPAALAGLSGQISVSAPDLHFDSNGASGRVDVDWRDAGTQLSSVKPLGDYRAQINGHGQIIDVNIETVRGALVVNGRGTINVSSHTWTFNGSARAVAHENELGPLLALIGPADARGLHAMTLSGRLP